MSASKAVRLPVPFKLVDREALAAVLARAEALAKDRDTKADDKALSAFGEVDRTDWSKVAVRALRTAKP